MYYTETYMTVVKNLRCVLRLPFHSLKIRVSSVYIFAICHRIVEEVQFLFNNRSPVTRPAEAASAINIQTQKARPGFSLLACQLGCRLQVSDRPGKVC